MNCVNCQSEISGKFCPNCGQRAVVKRITLKEAWFDFWSRVYGFDGMFPRTLRDLTIRPGVAAQRFIDGNRVLYYGPVGYFFLMITLYLLVLSMLGLNFVDFMKGAQSAVSQQGAQENRLAVETREIISNNIKIFAFCIIPFQAFTAKYLFFRKSGYNFLEHSVLPFYTQGHLYWVSILIAVGFKLTGSALLDPTAGGGWFLTFVTVISIGYFGFSYSTFFTYQSRVKSFFKGIFLYLVSQLLFMIALSIIVFIVIISLKYLAPDIFELIRPSNNR